MSQRNMKRRVAAMEPKNDDQFDRATAAATKWLAKPTSAMPTDMLTVAILLDKLRNTVASGNESVRPLLNQIEQQRFNVVMGWT